MLLAFSSTQNFENAFIHGSFLLIAVPLTFTFLSRCLFVSFASFLFLLLIIVLHNHHLTIFP